MSNLSKDTVYKGIQFQGNVGCLTLADEKIIFQQDVVASASPRSWLWKTMKKYQVIFSSDCPEGKRLVKISNRQNKAVSFLVPEIDVLALQEDIDSRMPNGDVTTDVEPSKTLVTAKEPSISAEKTNDMISKVQNIKVARQKKNRRQSDMMHTLTKNSKAKKAAMKKSKSFDPAFLQQKSKSNNDQSKAHNTKTTAKQGIKDKVVQVSAGELKKTPKKQIGQRSKASTEKPVPPQTSNKTAAKATKKLAARSNSHTDSNIPSKVVADPLRHTAHAPTSKRKAALGLAQDLIIKPGQQAVKDYVVNPTNNLIVVNANRKLVKPAKETAHKIKVIAKDMGLIKRQDSPEGLGGPSSHSNPANLVATSSA